MRKFVLLLLLFFSSWFAPLIAKSQADEITGRVVTAEGVGLPNVMVSVHSITADGAYVLLVSTGAGAGLNYVYPNNYDVGFAFHGLPPRWTYILRSRQFALRGLPDGEYFVVATTASNYTGLVSTPRRISVRGGDVTGVELKLLPLGSISGRVVIETLPGGCDSGDKITPDRLSITAIRDDLPKEDPAFSNLWWTAFPSPRPDEKGPFTTGHVYPGHYRIVTRFPSGYNYVKAITLPATVPKPGGGPVAVSNVSRDGVSLKQGEKLDGVVVTVAEGAASVRGKVIAKNMGARTPERLLAHLIPAEPGAADDVLRYAETPVYEDGAFAFNNIAPGKYWLMARAALNEEPGGRPSTPIAWDTNEREKLRRDAAAEKNVIELKACQRVKEHVLRW